MLETFAAGDYRFLSAPGRPFSMGVLADPGFDLVHAVLARPLPLETGFEAARKHLEAAGRPFTAIAGFELRIPAPLSQDGFDSFNQRYVERLSGMGLRAGALLPAARTNVAPSPPGVDQPSIFAFTYTCPGARAGQAFLLAGAPEAGAGTAEAMIDSIYGVLGARMSELGVAWSQVTAINLYAQELSPEAGAAVVRGAGPAAHHGIRWYSSLPPIEGLVYEIDARGAGSELVV